MKSKYSVRTHEYNWKTDVTISTGKNMCGQVSTLERVRTDKYRGMCTSQE